MNTLLKQKFIVLMVFTLLLSFFINKNATAQCTARSIIKDCKSRFVSPYKYSGCWMQEFFLEDKYKRYQGHFVVMEGLKYQILFCTSGSADNVVINLYDKSMEYGTKRKKYGSSKDIGPNLWIFEPTASGDYFVEYVIPPSKTGKPQTGCVMLMLGTIIETEEETETGQKVDPTQIIRKTVPKK